MKFMQLINQSDIVYVRFLKITYKDRLEIFFKKRLYELRRIFTKENVSKSSMEET